MYGVVLTVLYVTKVSADAEVRGSEYISEEQEIIRTCGLDAAYELQAYVLPRWTGGDLDGDDVLDVVAPVVRTADGRRGLAICRAGTWMDVLGMEERIGRELPSGYLDQLERWTVAPKDTLHEIPERNPLPLLTADVLVLERIEKSRYFIYWDGSGWQSHEDYVFVEP
ncbi:MAG: hypothetical protein K8I00_06015 [Candidatus Omnitrophica bacterium]|nr:hypothetical protein [Candidatus Omnitrophota bacterium]